MLRRIFTSGMLIITILVTSFSGGVPQTSKAQSVSAMPNEIFLPMIASGSAAPFIDESALPDAVKAGLALRQSLSAEQQVSITVMVERYNRRLSVVAQDLPKVADQDANAVPKPVSPEPDVAALKAPAAGEGINIQSMRAIQSEIDAINSDMEKEFASLLTSEQLKLFQASNPGAHRGAARALRSNQDASLQVSTTCYYAGYYAALAEYYLYYAYVYGYYNWYARGTTDSYYAYVYAYYAWYYSVLALQELGAAYFSIAATGSDFVGLGDDGTTHAYYAYLYGYYSAIYLKKEADNSGSTTAYYAYLYAYYGYTYAYYAYSYGYYYCQ